MPADTRFAPVSYFCSCWCLISVASAISASVIPAPVRSRRTLVPTTRSAAIALRSDRFFTRLATDHPGSENLRQHHCPASCNRLIPANVPWRGLNCPPPDATQPAVPGPSLLHQHSVEPKSVLADNSLAKSAVRSDCLFAADALLARDRCSALCRNAKPGEAEHKHIGKTIFCFAQRDAAN